MHRFLNSLLKFVVSTQTWWFVLFYCVLSVYSLLPSFYFSIVIHSSLQGCSYPIDDESHYCRHSKFLHLKKSFFNMIFWLAYRCLQCLRAQLDMELDRTVVRLFMLGLIPSTPLCRPRGPQWSKATLNPPQLKGSSNSRDWRWFSINTKWCTWMWCVSLLSILACFIKHTFSI